MTTPRDPRPATGANAGADELEADIERTREELGETVNALSEKLDPKAQAQQKVQEAKHRAAGQFNILRSRGTEVLVNLREKATDEQGNPKGAVLAGAGALAAAAVTTIVVVVAMRRRSTTGAAKTREHTARFLADARRNQLNAQRGRRHRTNKK